MAHNIFRTTDSEPLNAAHHLGDYEAVIVELIWPRLIGLHGGPGPGYSFSLDYALVKDARVALGRRTKELFEFLVSGGVVAVKGYARAVLEWSNTIGTQSVTASTDAWLIEAIPALRLNYSEIFELGSGTFISIAEPGHPLENVIRGATGYAALLRNNVFEKKNHIVLGTSRIGQPIAAELPVGRGLVFLLPSGVNDASLESALSLLLDDRARHWTSWILPRETELLKEEDGIREAVQEELKRIRAERDWLADIRIEVLRDVHVERALTYYENGVSATRDIRRAMQDLHKLVEMLEAVLGGSEDQMAKALGVPKTRFRHIKKLANQKEYDFRHTTSGEPVGADAADIEQARDDARELVQKFIERRSAEEVDRRLTRSAQAQERN
jgi:hypothetical protein